MKRIDLEKEIKNSFENDDNYLKLNKAIVNKLNSSSFLKKMSRTSWISLSAACIIILAVTAIVVLKHSPNSGNANFVCQYNITLEESEKVGWLADIVGDDNTVQISYSKTDKSESNQSNNNVVIIQGSNGEEKMSASGVTAYQNGIELDFSSNAIQTSSISEVEHNVESQGATLFFERNGQDLTGISTKFTSNDSDVLMQYKHTDVSDISYTGDFGAFINSTGGNKSTLPSLDLGTEVLNNNISTAIPTELPATLPTILPKTLPIILPVIPNRATPTAPPSAIPTDIPATIPPILPSAPPIVLPTTQPIILLPTDPPPTTQPVVVLPTDDPPTNPPDTPEEPPTASPTNEHHDSSYHNNKS